MIAIPAFLIASLVIGYVNIDAFIRQPAMFCENAWDTVDLSSLELIALSTVPHSTAFLTISSTARYVGLRSSIVSSLAAVSIRSSLVFWIFSSGSSLNVFSIWLSMTESMNVWTSKYASCNLVFHLGTSHLLLLPDYRRHVGPSSADLRLLVAWSQIGYSSSPAHECWPCSWPA